MLYDSQNLQPTLENINFSLKNIGPKNSGFTFNLGPACPLIYFAISTALFTNSATWSKSYSVKPRVVSAGVPILNPLGTIADLSPDKKIKHS